MFHIVSNKKFRALRLRNERLEKMETNPVLDERIIPTLFLLSVIDEIQTIWSCSGHTVNEQNNKQLANKQPGFVQNPLFGEFYFIFGAGRNSEKFLSFLSEFVVKHKRKGFNLNAISLNWSFDNEGKTLSKETRPKVKTQYPAWKFGFKYRLKDHGQYLETIEFFNRKLWEFCEINGCFLQMFVSPGVSRHAT